MQKDKKRDPVKEAIYQHHLKEIGRLADHFGIESPADKYELNYIEARNVHHTLKRRYEFELHDDLSEMLDILRLDIPVPETVEEQDRLLTQLFMEVELNNLDADQRRRYEILEQKYF